MSKFCGLDYVSLLISRSGVIKAQHAVNIVSGMQAQIYCSYCSYNGVKSRHFKSQWLLFFIIQMIPGKKCIILTRFFGTQHLI